MNKIIIILFSFLLISCGDEQKSPQQTEIENTSLEISGGALSQPQINNVSYKGNELSVNWQVNEQVPDTSYQVWLKRPSHINTLLAETKQNTFSTNIDTLNVDAKVKVIAVASQQSVESQWTTVVFVGGGYGDIRTDSTEPVITTTNARIEKNTTATVSIKITTDEEFELTISDSLNGQLQLIQPVVSDKEPSYRYQPNTDYSGYEVIEFTVTTTTNLTVTENVIINVYDIFQAESVLKNSAQQAINLPTSLADAYAISLSNNVVATKGSVAINGQTILYTPNADETGTDSFTVEQYDNAESQTASKEWLIELDIIEDERSEEEKSFNFVVSVESGKGVTFFTNNYYTYNYTVDWGDDTTTANATGDISHSYDSAGEYEVVVTGLLPAVMFSGYLQECLITEISQWGINRWDSMHSTFYECHSLTHITAQDTPDLSRVFSMSHTFANAISFNGDISLWDVSNVEYMWHMFYNARSFNGDISSWDVSNVYDMRSMFSNARSFNGDISTWDVSNVYDINDMFSNAEVFNSDLSAWDVRNVYAMARMFLGARSFNSDISSWDVSNATDMHEMFAITNAFNSDLSAWDVSNVTDMSSMFSHASAFNGDLSSWNVGNVIDMQRMFRFASAFNNNLSSWDVSNVADMSYMFNGARSFNSNLTDWDVSKVTNMKHMFSTYNIGWNTTSIFNGDLSTWDVSNVTDMSYMFYETSVFNGDLSSWDVSNVTDMSYMIYDASVFNSDLSTWDVRNVTDMSSMFYEAFLFNSDLSSWDVSNVMDMSSMFYEAFAFNSDLSSWDVSNVTNMNSMFSYAIAFNCDLSSWDVSKVSSMGGMFSAAYSFNGDVSPWDVGNVTNMAFMFGSWNDSLNNHSPFNGDLSSWDVSNVTDMSSMFYRVSSFNGDLSSWDVSNVTDMSDMFYQAAVFNGDLSPWDVSNVTSHGDFSNGLLISPIWP